jgi:hypothetical protein
MAKSMAHHVSVAPNLLFKLLQRAIFTCEINTYRSSITRSVYPNGHFVERIAPISSQILAIAEDVERIALFPAMVA